MSNHVASLCCQGTSGTHQLRGMCDKLKQHLHRSLAISQMLCCSKDFGDCIAFFMKRGKVGRISERINFDVKLKGGEKPIEAKELCLVSDRKSIETILFIECP